MRRILRLAVLVVAIFSCAACLATTGGSADENPPAGVNKPASDSSDEPSEPEESAGSQELSFGKSYTWDDGLTITIGKPSKFKPSDYAEVDGAKAYRRFTITVVNKTSGPIDLAVTYITMQSNNKEAEQVFDSEKGLEGSPSTKLLKGRESEWDIGFGVANPDDMVMEIAINDNFERPSIIYTT
ncbi:hypothetical protein MLP_38630 [Microlunatus phosphovorus NM-1]|uniref:DUF4352 domain-containing protein n=1 Tax=Microlunatus phosphovorus (strain ATCC 700054 / DSM 10555 / JCM 9379 / NBRC 101784 / NCIMB 13414 / VKM Ac-1990 / NM-1) TaxID=1032480 RepID=F5XQ46_MICPN|nr:hypothetical protein [Microlunatus phosphovorus]BAK36877.1 hypothetical protein MLP_38630 [Microlunatus phosphovorus NM-1]